jgi:hypothetical protein
LVIGTKPFLVCPSPALIEIQYFSNRLISLFIVASEEAANELPPPNRIEEKDRYDCVRNSRDFEIKS